MNTTRPRRIFRFRKVGHRFLNLLLVVAMLMSLTPLPAAAKSGHTSPTPRTAGACDLPQIKVYIPLVQKVSSSLRSILPVLSPVDSTVVSRTLQYEVGKTYSYEWDTVISSKTEGRNTDGVQTSGDSVSRVYAIADVTIRSKENDGTFVAEVSMHNVFLCNTDSQGNENVETEQEFLDLFKTPLVFRQKPDGTIVEVKSAQGALPVVTNVQKGVINVLQVILREGSSYEATEHGGQGDYKTKYTVAEISGSLNITKTIGGSDFSNLNSNGDKANSLQAENTIQIVLDGQKGVFSSVMFGEKIQTSDESKDPQSTDDNGLDGLAVWSTVNSQGSLTLKSVANTPATARSAFVPLSALADDNLLGNITEDYSDQNGINLASVDIDAALAAVEVNTADFPAAMYVMDLAAADQGTTVLDKIKVRIEANAANDAIVTAYIDILGAISTPGAQAILSGILGNSQVMAMSVAAPFSATSQDQALLSIVLLDSPTEQTIQTLQNLSQDDTYALQDEAITVLGAAADAIRDTNATLAGQVTQDLKNALDQAQSEDEVALYLDALGNTGDPGILSTLETYITSTVKISDTLEITDTLNIQVAALDALRKIPGDQAEGLLLSVLGDEGQADAVRELALAVLGGRDIDPEVDLSNTALGEIQGYEQQALAQPGLYRKDWTRTLGGTSVGVELPGYITVSSPPKTSRLELYARQEANAHVWTIVPNYSLAEGELWSTKSGNNQQFGVRFSLFNNAIKREYINNLTCSTTRSGNLLNKRFDFLDVKKTIVVFAVIPVTLQVKAYGNFRLDYKYTANVCNPVDSSLKGELIPSISATVEGSASATLAVVRGGITLEADLLNTEIPASLTAAYNGSKLNFCVDVKVETQPINGKIFIWLDNLVKTGKWYEIKFKWQRSKEQDLVNFSSPKKTYDVLVRCY